MGDIDVILYKIITAAMVEAYYVAASVTSLIKYM